MADLIFNPLQVICSECGTHIEVSLEELEYKDVITCSNCKHTFTPDIKTESLVKLMKMAERGLESDSGLDS